MDKGFPDPQKSSALLLVIGLRGEEQIDHRENRGASDLSRSGQQHRELLVLRVSQHPFPQGGQCPLREFDQKTRRGLCPHRLFLSLRGDRWDGRKAQRWPITHPTRHAAMLILSA